MRDFEGIIFSILYYAQRENCNNFYFIYFAIFVIIYFSYLIINNKKW